MEILKTDTINEIIKRMAIEIVEHNFEESKVYLAGINNNGYLFAKILLKELGKISENNFDLIRLKIDPAKPMSSEITLSTEAKILSNKVVIIVDDVVNSGRTLFYATRPLMEVLCKKVEIAVLVDRKHTSFPISAKYVGISLATTLKENIKVSLSSIKERSVVLE